MPNNHRFVRHVGSHEAALPILPAVHTTTVAGLGGIVTSGAIDITECKFYKEDLIYLFYGKPAYKIKGRTSSASRILGDAAVTFVFDATNLPPPYRLYALDTGAAFGERYDEYLPQGVDIEDFRLQPSMDNLGRLVKAFFGRNYKYFMGDPSLATPPKALDVASQSYIDIASSAVAINLDDRACTAEVQFNVSLKLSSLKILTVVMPGQAFDDPEVQSALNSWKVKPLLYRMRRSLPSERTEVIYEKLADFYELSGFFHD